MLDQVEITANTMIIGKEDRKSNWKIVRAKDGNHRQTIGDQSMPNTRVRKFINKFEILTDICVTDETRKLAWNDCIAKYREVMILARKREDFLDQEIDLFQDTADNFFEKWLDLHGVQGLTNYIHMIGSGHFHFYLTEWRNLYRYSQQGWESLNSEIKQVYFRRTQRGGNSGLPGTNASKLLPVGKWMLRRMFWLSGRSLQDSVQASENEVNEMDNIA
jgi:hypothetical protein